MFSLTSRLSFEEASALREKIVIAKDNDHVPMVLVGNKSDLDGREVSAAEAQQLAKAWGVPYFETSALKRINVVEAFKECVRQCVRGVPVARREKPKSRCVLL